MPREPFPRPARHAKCELCQFTLTDVVFDKVTHLKLCRKCWTEINPNEYGRMQHLLEVIPR